MTKIEYLVGKTEAIVIECWEEDHYVSYLKRLSAISSCGKTENDAIANLIKLIDKILRTEKK